MAPLGILRVLAVAVGFLVVAVLVGRFVAPRLFDLVVRMRVRYVLLVFAIAFALGLSAAAALVGSALIIGAFAAGAHPLGNQPVRHHRAGGSTRGVHLHTYLLRERRRLGKPRLARSHPRRVARASSELPRSLTLLAIVGKLAAGWAAPWVKFRRLVVGVGMVPRGEVGLIFADIGRRAGILNEAVFGAILLMVMATTFVAPPGLKVALPTVLGADAGAMIATADKLRSADLRPSPGGLGRSVQSCSPMASSICSTPAMCELLEAARREGDVLIVGINSDASVRRLGKGTERPVMPEAARARVVAGLRCGGLRGRCSMSDTPLELIKALAPDVLVKGADYARASIVGGDWVESRGGRVVRVPLVSGFSTSSLVERLRATS